MAKPRFPPAFIRHIARYRAGNASGDITPIAREERASNLQTCGACDMRLARRIGAEFAITGTAQKVSQ
jgi:hypothetical protein